MLNTTAYALIDWCVLWGDFDHNTDMFITRLWKYKVDEQHLRFSLNDFEPEQVKNTIIKYKEINKQRSLDWDEAKKKLAAVQKELEICSKLVSDTAKLIKIYERHKPNKNWVSLFA